jgi:hypothetical protein
MEWTAMRELDEHVSNTSDQTVPVASYLADDPPPEPPTLRTMLIKYGWRAGAVGMGVTVLGSWQLSLDTLKHAILPQVIHSVGLIIMLGGCCVALIGYRLPWLIRVGIALRDITLAERTRSEGGGRTAESKQTLRSVGLAVLCGGPPLVTILLLVMWVIPAWAAGLVICVANMLFMVKAFVVVSSGSRLQRAFAMGAIVPLTFLILQLGLVMLIALGNSAGFGSSYGNPSFSAEMRRLSVTLAYVGAYRLGAVIIWIAAVGCGAVAVAVRIVLYRINRF